MDMLDTITRDDLVLAIQDIALQPLNSIADRDAYVALIDGRRYDPRALVDRVLRRAGAPPDVNEFSQNDPDLIAFFEKRRIPVVRVSALGDAVSRLTALKHDPEAQKDLRDIIDSKDEVIDRYRPRFSTGATETLTEDDIWGFLDWNNNHHWSGLQRQRRFVTSDMDALHRALAILVDESRPINERLNEIRPINGKTMVKGIGPAIITAFLHVSNPDTYGVWNGTSETGWLNTGLWPAQSSKTSFGDYYQTINEILKALAMETGVDLWTLDALWWRFEWNKELEKNPAETETVSKESAPEMHRPTEQEAFRGICAIAQRIAELGLADKMLSRTPDSSENSARYHSFIRPLIDDFVRMNGTTPNLFLESILKGVISEHDLAEEYDAKGFHFYGQKLHSYTWAEISRKGPEPPSPKASYYPQLLIGVNPYGVRFGFTYGDSVSASDPRVTRVQQDPALQEMVIAKLKANPTLLACDKTSSSTVIKADDGVTDALREGDFREWTNTILLVEWHELPGIPDDIVDRIKSTLSALVPLFRSISESTSPPTETWGSVRDQLAYPFDCSLPFDGLHFTDKSRRRLIAEILGALRAGKHIIITGPPGTGKSKIAQAVCEAITGRGNYHMCTASPDWSVFETIGGYRPRPDTTLEFHPGAFLRSFRANGEPANRWLIVDEINRADIDKAFGPLFSALAGDDVFLPFEIAGEPVRLIGRPEDGTPLRESHFIVHPDWRIIATMNTFDKSSLYEMSYAFMRRFAFVMVDAPDEVDADLVGQYADAWGFEKDDEVCQRIADLWNLVNRHRRIGPALFHDIFRFLVEEPEAGMDSAIALFLFPQFEGLREDQQISFVKEVVAQGVVRDPEQFRRRAATFFHINPKGLA